MFFLILKRFHAGVCGYELRRPGWNPPSQQYVLVCKEVRHLI